VSCRPRRARGTAAQSFSEPDADTHAPPHARSYEPDAVKEGGVGVEVLAWSPRAFACVPRRRGAV
jgi:hypothetical protein